MTPQPTNAEATPATRWRRGSCGPPERLPAGTTLLHLSARDGPRLEPDATWGVDISPALRDDLL
jgi:hypothetical protein